MGIVLAIPASLGRIKASARGDLLADTFSRWLGEPVTVEVAEDYRTLSASITEDRAALVWAPPMVCARVGDHARCIYAAMRGGRAGFRAALVVRNDGPTAVEGLQGLRAAWTDRHSAGGCVLARNWLSRHVSPPAMLFEEERYLGSYQEAIRAVVSGSADLCSVYVNGDTEEDALASLKQLSPGSERSLRPLVLTEEAPGDGLVLTRALTDEQARGLTERLDAAEGAWAIVLDLLDADALVRTDPKAWRVLGQED